MATTGGGDIPTTAQSSSHNAFSSSASSSALLASNYRPPLPWESYDLVSPPEACKTPAQYFVHNINKRFVQYLSQRFREFQTPALLADKESSPSAAAGGGGFLLVEQWRADPPEEGGDRRLHELFESYRTVAREGGNLSPFVTGMMEWRKERLVKGVELSEEFLQRINKSEREDAIKVLAKRKQLSVHYVFCKAVLIGLETWDKKTNTLADTVADELENLCFSFFNDSRAMFQPKASKKSGTTLEKTGNKAVIFSLYGEILGMLSACFRFNEITEKFFEILDRDSKSKDNAQSLVVINGLRSLRLDLHTPKHQKESIEFLKHILDSHFDAKTKKPEIQLAICELLAHCFSRMIESKPTTSTKEGGATPLDEWERVVSELYTISEAFFKKHKSVGIMYMFQTSAICVGPAKRFDESLKPLLSSLLKCIKPGEKHKTVALECVYKLLLTILIQKDKKQFEEYARLIAEKLFPKQKKKEIISANEDALDIIVDIINLISVSELEFAAQNIVVSSLKEETIPERTMVGLLAFNAITDRLGIDSSGDASFESQNMADSISDYARGKKAGKGGAALYEAKGKSGLSYSSFSLNRSFRKDTLKRRAELALLKLSRKDEEKMIVDDFLKGVSKSLDAILLNLDNLFGHFLHIDPKYSGKNIQDLVSKTAASQLTVLHTVLSSLRRALPDQLPPLDLFALLSKYTLHVDKVVSREAFGVLQHIMKALPSRRTILMEQFSIFTRSIPDTAANQKYLKKALKLLKALLEEWRMLAKEGEGDEGRKANAYLNYASQDPSSKFSEAQVEGTALIFLCSAFPDVRGLAASILRLVHELNKTLPPRLATSNKTLITTLREHQHDLFVQSSIDPTATPPPHFTGRKTQEETTHNREAAEGDWDEGGNAKIQEMKDLILGVFSSPELVKEQQDRWSRTLARLVIVALGFSPDSISIAFQAIAVRLSQVQSLAESAASSFASSKDTSFSSSGGGGSSSAGGSSTSMISPRSGSQPVSPIMAQLESSGNYKARGPCDANIILWRNYSVVLCAACAACGSPEGDTSSFTIFERLLSFIKKDKLLRRNVTLALSFVQPSIFPVLFDRLENYDKEVGSLQQKLSKGKVKPADAQFIYEMSLISRIAASALEANTVTQHSIQRYVTWIKQTQEYLIAMLSEGDAFPSSLLQKLRFNFFSTVYHILPIVHSVMPSASSEQTQSQQLSQVIDKKYRKDMFVFLSTYCGHASDFLKTAVSQSALNLETPRSSRSSNKNSNNTLRGRSSSSASAAEKLIRLERAVQYSALEAMAALLLGESFYEETVAHDKKGPLFGWLTELFRSSDEQVHRIGHNAMELYLHDNADQAKDLFHACADLCYDEHTYIAKGYFLLASWILLHHDFAFSLPLVLNLCLTKMSSDDFAVRDMALKLLAHAAQTDKYSISPTPAIQDTSLSLLYKLSGMLAEDHAELASAVAHGIWQRITTTKAHHLTMLFYMPPWLQTIDLAALKSDSLKHFLQRLAVITLKYGKEQALLVEKLWTSLAHDNSSNIALMLDWLLTTAIETRNEVFFTVAIKISVALARVDEKRTIEKLVTNLHDTVPFVLNSNEDDEQSESEADEDRSLTESGGGSGQGEETDKKRSLKLPTRRAKKKDKEKEKEEKDKAVDKEKKEKAAEAEAESAASLGVWSFKKLFAVNLKTPHNLSKSHVALGMMSELVAEHTEEASTHVATLLHCAFMGLDSEIPIFLSYCKRLLVVLLHSLVAHHDGHLSPDSEASTLISQITGQPSTSKLWKNEDITKDNLEIGSTKELQRWVGHVLSALSPLLPDLVQRWSKEALLWASRIGRVPPHFVYRSFQIYRALAPCLDLEAVTVCLATLYKHEDKRPKGRIGLAIDIMQTLMVAIEQTPKETLLRFPQVFWGIAALLYTDYEGEFLYATRVMLSYLRKMTMDEDDEVNYKNRKKGWEETLLEHLPSNRVPPFVGLQPVLLKGLTSKATVQDTIIAFQHLAFQLPSSPSFDRLVEPSLSSSSSSTSNRRYLSTLLALTPHLLVNMTTTAAAQRQTDEQEQEREQKEEDDEDSNRGNRDKEELAPIDLCISLSNLFTSTGFSEMAAIFHKLSTSPAFPSVSLPSSPVNSANSSPIPSVPGTLKFSSSLSSSSSSTSSSVYNNELEFLMEWAPLIARRFFPSEELDTFSLLMEMLDLGPARYHRVLLWIIYSLLQQVDWSKSKLRHLGTGLFAPVAKHLEGRLWREAMAVMQVAVRGSSSLPSVNIVGMEQSTELPNVLAEMEAPSRTWNIDDSPSTSSTTNKNDPRKSPQQRSNKGRQYVSHSLYQVLSTLEGGGSNEYMKKLAKPSHPPVSWQLRKHATGAHVEEVITSSSSSSPLRKEQNRKTSPRKATATKPEKKKKRKSTSTQKKKKEKNKIKASDAEPPKQKEKTTTKEQQQQQNKVKEKGGEEETEGATAVDVTSPTFQQSTDEGTVSSLIVASSDEENEESEPEFEEEEEPDEVESWEI